MPRSFGEVLRPKLDRKADPAAWLAFRAATLWGEYCEVASDVPTPQAEHAAAAFLEAFEKMLAATPTTSLGAACMLRTLLLVEEGNFDGYVISLLTNIASFLET
jgi:hypothetical protein